LFKRLAVVAAALLVFAAAFILKESQKQSSDAVPDPRSAQVTEKALPRLVDLGSDKCIPCKKMAPILEELRNEYRGALVVEFIDVWKDPEAGKPFGIRVIPTQVFIDASGVERFRHEGFMAKEAILAKWKELGVELSPSASDVGS
jgi:thioredoxin 1